MQLQLESQPPRHQLASKCSRANAEPQPRNLHSDRRRARTKAPPEDLVPCTAKCGDGIDAWVPKEVTIFIKQSRFDEGRGNLGERRMDAVLAIRRQRHPQQLAIPRENLL